MTLQTHDAPTSAPTAEELLIDLGQASLATQGGLGAEPEIVGAQPVGAFKD